MPLQEPRFIKDGSAYRIPIAEKSSLRPLILAQVHRSLAHLAASQEVEKFVLILDSFLLTGGFFAIENLLLKLQAPLSLRT